MTAPRLTFAVPGYALAAVRRADGSGSWLVEAHDLERDRRVLLKVLARADADDPVAHRTEERLRREARAAARVHHPSIVRVFDLVETADCLALVMEAVDAPDLDTLLRQGGPLAPVRAAAIARDVARGLHELHRAGVVHRDVTPTNVLVPARGPAVLVDLGLARLRDAGPLTAPDVLLGTPAYMAPEQAETPRDADLRADLYGLGATLFTMLAGGPPFPGEGLEPLRQALAGGAPDMRTRRPDCGAALAQLVARCLARDREARPASAAEVAGALDALAGADPAPPSPTTTPIVVELPDPVAPSPAAAPPARRHAGLAGFALGFVAALALVVATWPGRPHAGARPPAPAPTPSIAPPATAPESPPPTPPPPPAPTVNPETLASRAMQLGDHLARAGVTPWERAQGALLGLALHTAVVERLPDSFAATRLRVRHEERARMAEQARARVLADLSERVHARLDMGEFRAALAAIDAATAIAEADRLPLRALVWQRARAGLQRTERLALARAARDGVGAGVALLEDEARRTLAPLAAEARAAIERLRRPPTAAEPAAPSPGARPLELLLADCDDAMLMGEPETAIALLDLALADPARAAEHADLAPRRAEAVALSGFLDRLGVALGNRTGLAVPLPGGTAATLVSAGRNALTVRRGAAIASLRVLDRGARFAEALARLAWPEPAGDDALALGCLLHLDGEDSLARPWLARARAQGAAAARVLTLVEARLAAERAERAAALLDEARVARERDRPPQVLRVLDRIDREGLGPLSAAADAEARQLASWAHARRSGFEGLTTARIGAGSRGSEVALTWDATAGLGSDAEAVVERTFALRPRWRGGVGMTLSATRATPLGDRAAIAVTAANGLRAELRLLPDGRAALWLDGTETTRWSEMSLPLRLAVDERAKQLVVHLPGQPARAQSWAGTSPFQAWVSDLGPDTELRVEGTLDVTWLHEARRAARKPSAPRALACEGPPRALRVRWEPPEHGQALGYRLWWAMGDDPARRLLAPLTAFRQSRIVTGTTARLELPGAWVAGVYVEAIGPDHEPGPASAVRYAADLGLAGASAVAVGARGEVYVAVARDPVVVRLRADGLPERVDGVPPRGARAPAPAALTAAPGRYGTVLAVSDPEGTWCWAWGPGLEARPFGHAAGARWSALAVDGLGNWWAADALGHRLYSFWGQRLAPIHWIGDPGGAERFGHAGPCGLAVLADGRIAASDPGRDRVVLFRRLEGWYAVDRMLADLPDARALAATPDGRLAVGTGASVTVLTLAPEGAETARRVVREVPGGRLDRVRSLAAGPDGAVWVLDAGGTLVTLPR